MLTNIINRLTILPRWIIILIDLAVIVISSFISYFLRFNFDVAAVKAFHAEIGIFIITGTSLLVIIATKSYRGIVRYTGIDDGIRLLKTNFIILILLCAINLIYFYNVSRNLIPYSVIFITFFVSFLFLFYYRLLVKTLFAYYKAEYSDRNSIMIYGAGQSGLITKQVIDSDITSNSKVVGFLDDNPRKIGNVLGGVPIFSGMEDIGKIFHDRNVKELIFSIKELSVQRKNEIVDQCLKYHIKIRTVPPVEKWVRGELSLNQIKEIKIDDLLGRESISLENADLIKELQGRVICISGAAGSIGSELARQLLQYKPEALILIDQSESALYEIELELKDNHRESNIFAFVADICNAERIRYIFRELKPEIIFHAAAYKHVPLMESNPYEAVLCNILGTRNLADLAVEFQVRRFIMISTDKAVNPTSIMGCTKRLAEIYVQSLNNNLELMGIQHTQFITTRFGNVLGSNGSVIPIFKKQIAAGGPVTVTHPDVVRYFMTIPEACQLVMEASVMGRGGEIFIFDMGDPVKIYDLAKKMIMLSGLEVGKDVDIVFSGLRDGEKLFEELLNDQESTIPTHHEKILKAKVKEYSYNEINRYIDLMQDMLFNRDELKIVALMKEIVPEFKSNFSRFEVLD